MKTEILNCESCIRTGNSNYAPKKHIAKDQIEFYDDSNTYLSVCVWIMHKHDVASQETRKRSCVLHVVVEKTGIRWSLSVRNAGKFILFGNFATFLWWVIRLYDGQCFKFYIFQTQTRVRATQFEYTRYYICSCVRKIIKSIYNGAWRRRYWGTVTPRSRYPCVIARHTPHVWDAKKKRVSSARSALATVASRSSLPRVTLTFKR